MRCKNSVPGANAAGELPDQFNVDDYLKTGMVMNPMGVSGQAGKSKPETGMYVILMFMKVCTVQITFLFS
jgi:hypothetical protein